MSSTLRRRPTILDIAAAAGVSKSLVSLALRGDAGVSDVTRNRIVGIADQLGYRSNAVARALVQGRTATVAAVATELANPYHSEVIGGVERAADDLGFDVLISHGRRDPARIVHRIERMLELNLDAIVIVSSWAPRDVLVSAARHVPIVVVGRMPEPVDGVDSIVSDDEGGARAAVEHLLALGHRSIAFATSSHRPAALARQAGYRAAVRDHAPMRVVDVSDDPGDAIARFLDDLGRPDAVIANNDVTAVRIMDAALDRSLRIPHDLAIVGYDDTTLARLVRPALSSVDQPNDEIGRIAMGMVQERLSGRTVDRHETVRPRLVVRASSQG